VRAQSNVPHQLSLSAQGANKVNNGSTSLCFSSIYIIKKSWNREGKKGDKFGAAGRSLSTQ
jgi:hypothetical protein